MAYSRYSNTAIFLNNNEKYKNALFDQRDIKQTYQYALTPMIYPSTAAIQGMTNIPLVWSATDKLYNVSNDYYGSPDYWWIIAFYNKKASEAEFKTGELYFVPLPLEEMLEYF